MTVGAIYFIQRNPSESLLHVDEVLADTHADISEYKGFNEKDAVFLACDHISPDVAAEWRDSGIPAEYLSCYVDSGVSKSCSRAIYEKLGKYSSVHNVSAYAGLSEDDVRACLDDGFIGYKQMTYVHATEKDGRINLPEAKKWRGVFDSFEASELIKAGLSFEQAREACEHGYITVEAIEKYWKKPEGSP